MCLVLLFLILQSKIKGKYWLTMEQIDIVAYDRMLQECYFLLYLAMETLSFALLHLCNRKPLR